MRGTKQTIGIVLCVFGIQVLTTSFLGVVSLDFFSLEYPLDSDPWTIVLNIYSHGGVGHLVSNLIALAILGIIVETVTNVKRFHIFFIITGILAALAQIAFNVMFVSAGVGVVGASGSIFALMGYAIMGNNLADTFMNFVDLGKIGTILLLVTLAVFVTIMTAGENVALVAHAVGFLLGAIAGYFRILHVK